MTPIIKFPEDLFWQILKVSVGFVWALLQIFWPYLVLIIAVEIALHTFSPRNSGTYYLRRIFSKSGESTAYAQWLHKALVRRGIDAKIQYPDGHKTVDIAILPAKLYIEVDGTQHSTNPKQIIKDLERDEYSRREGFSTIHVPNSVSYYHGDQVAEAIAQVARERAGKNDVMNENAPTPKTNQ
jgi:very-short-patch-repair endonuclease